MKKIHRLLFTVSVFVGVLCTSNYIMGQHVTNCFASDPAMGSTKWDDHYNWARTHDASQLAANVKLKVNLFYNCQSADDYTLRASFANVSAIIAKHSQTVTCFTNDAGAKNTDVLAHYDWAKSKTRQQLLENLQGKVTEAFKCMSSQEQKSFFADLSVSIALTASKLNTGNKVIQNGGNNPVITQAGEWKVWLKTSPCSGRNDWITVAKENPTAGGNFFYLANQIFPGTNCTGTGCTFQDATALANILRTSDEFSKYCCKDYSVWKNNVTGKMTVVVGKFGTAGPGWSPVSTQLLCCEDAEALAGIPGVCSGIKNGDDNNESQGDGWKVWIKTSPCSGRHDWLTVAKENPAYGGGGGVWYPANQVVTTTGMNCTNLNSSCTFAAATAEAATLRSSSSFSNYCCKDYSVWKNEQTGKMSIVLGKFGIAGYPWSLVKGDLCCEDAETLAGIPGACSGTKSNITCVPNSYAAWNPQTQKTECFCYPGFVWNSSMTECIQLKKDCSGIPESYSVWNETLKQYECKCKTGFEWNDSHTACVPIKPDCNASFPNSEAKWNPQKNAYECYCKAGYQWNAAGNACVLTVPDCNASFPNSEAKWNPQKNAYECYCKTGYQWNAAGNACVLTVPDCNASFPNSEAKWNPQKNVYECYCKAGYQWNAAGNACVLTVPDCNASFPNSEAKWNPQKNAYECYCKTGYQWNAAGNACVLTVPDCNASFPNSEAKWNPQKNAYECYCKTGYQWNAAGNSCVEIGKTNDGTSGNGGTGTGNWTLESVTVNPPDPSKVWRDNEWTYNAQSPSAQYGIYNGAYKVNHTWTAPPQQFNSNGFAITMNVSCTATGGQSISGIIGVSGSGLTADTEDQSAYAKGEGSASASKTVNFKPASNYADVEVKISIGWGSVTYTYKYKRN